jgi:mRNA-degrading endonuclease RelE of RelBE toxin-antitoxin system
MHIVFHKQFEKDISKYPPDLLRDIFHFVETVEEADTLYAMPHIKKMQGYKNYYRYKI